MRLKELISIKPILRVIDFQSKDRSLIDGYVVMEQTAKHFVNILEGFTRQRDEKTTEIKGSIVPDGVNRCHKITGTYGVGKSYFLLMLKSMLEALEDEIRFEGITRKFKDFESIQYQLNVLRNQGKRYIIVDINGKNFAEIDFKSVIEGEVYDKLVEKIGRENLNFISFYEKTIMQLNAWKKENSPLYELFANRFMNEADYTYDEMINDLANRENNAKDIYIKIYKSIMNEEPSNKFETLQHFIKEANENVKNNGYDGIVILFDEFSTYLLGRSEKGYLNIDLGSIDILAEGTMPRSLNQIHFITTEHEDIEKILQKSIGNLSTVRKTAGRFKNYSLHFEKGAKLVENIIEKDIEIFNKIKFENTNTFDQYEIINKYASLSNIYPINPFTLEYLIKISEKYAQGDRTLFTFIDDDLRSFIEQNDVMLENNELNLVDVDTVMDCFGNVILKGKEEFAKAYNTQIERARNKIQQKIVKALALDYAITITDVGKIKSGINDENIKYILSLSDEETKEAKDYLTKEKNDSNSYIIYNDGTNGYELSPDSQGIDIEEEINKVLIHTNEKRFLEDLILERSTILDIKKTFTIPKASKIFPFERSIEGWFVKGLGELKSINILDEIKKCESDGKIFFYIPAAGQSYDYNIVMEMAKEKADEFIDDRIVIAIPKEFTFASSDVALLKRYEALGRLTKNDNVMSNPKAQNTIRLEIVRLRNEIYSKLSAFGRSENFVFLFKDEILECVDNMNEMLVDWLVNKLYPKFPVVETEDFSTRNAGNQLIQNLIVPRKAENVDLDSSKVYVKQIKMALAPLDLVNFKQTAHGYRVEIKKPATNTITSEIFKVFEIPDEEKSIKEKYNLLKSQPYGLNDPLFEVLFSIFIKTSDKHYLVDKDDKRVEVTADNINSLWDKGYRLCITKDSVSFNIKKDVINILEIIDKGYSNTRRYVELSPTMASDEFGDVKKLAIIVDYINILKQNIEILITNLEMLSISATTIELIDDVKKYLEKVANIIHPNDILNFVSNLINIHFDNNILINESGEINISRYKKLQNFIDNTKWLNKNRNVIRELKEKNKNLQLLTRNINFNKLTDYVNISKKQLNNVLNKELISDNWRNAKYERNIDLDELNKSLANATKEYNEKHRYSHGMLNIVKNELLDAVKEYEFIPLIKSLELINYADLTKLSNIENKVNSIRICKYEISGNDEIIKCPSCGTLDELLKNIDKVKDEKRDVTKNLGGLADKYIEKTDGLAVSSEVKDKYNKNETLIEYVAKNYPDKLEVTRELFSNIREGWMENHTKITELVNIMYPVINEYIKLDDNMPETEVKSIGYKEILNKINNLIKLSGYKKMSIDEFEKQILKEINNLRNNYNEINVDE